MKSAAFSGILRAAKYILTALAVLNLILLFGFQYEVPSVIQNKFFHSDDSTDPAQTSSDKTKHTEPLNFIFETDTLTYDGSTSLNLLDGVTVTDETGSPLELDIYSSIKSTDDSSTKLITYSVKDEEGNSIQAERKLVLLNYYGPALAVSQPYPEIYDTELVFIPATFKESGLLSANDGYGRNISDFIQCSYKVSNDLATEVTVTFTITNHFDDTASHTITLPITRTKPLILLKETSITLTAGEGFQPLSYVESATNEEGDDLTDRITIEGSVNLSQPGEYTITYNLTDSDREAADPVVLKVTVEE